MQRRLAFVERLCSEQSNVLESGQDQLSSDCTVSATLWQCPLYRLTDLCLDAGIGSRKVRKTGASHKVRTEQRHHQDVHVRMSLLSCLLTRQGC